MIVTLPAPILHKIAKEVKEFGDSFWNLVDELYQTGSKKDAKGISAPQVGDLLRVSMIFQSPDVMLLINPFVLSQSEAEMDSIEECLSIPGKKFKVKRPVEVSIISEDLDKRFFTLNLGREKCIPFLHEIDHLNGILISDKGEEVGDNAVDS